MSHFIKYAIAAIWLVNGLFCKVFNLVPRHEQIVAAILGDEYSRTFTLLIGVLEVFMAFWILSEFRYRLNAIIQIALVSTMNIIEIILVPDLLLWGRLNVVFALMFIIVIHFYAFKMKRNSIQTS